MRINSRFRVSTVVLIVLGASMISLNILLNTKISNKNGANKNSNMNLEVEKDKISNAEVVIETKVNNKGQLTRTAGTVDGSTAKNRTVWKHLPPGTQMGELQVEAIKKVIQSEGNVLVWGLGNDSPFWHDSTRGKVVFIEPKGFWYKKIIDEYPYLEAYTVEYTTETEKSFDRYINSPEIWSELDIRSQLPPVIKHTHWNVIIVDAPPGYKGAPGRYQSIYTSSLLARNGTHIFVDDYERKVEKEFSRKMLGSPIEVVKRRAKGTIGTNEQVHFIHQ